MPDKPIGFGIKVWLLASSKSRFVWRIEVYFDALKQSSKNLLVGLYKESNSDVRGSILIRMHIHRQMGDVSWQYKKLVTLLSTTATP